MRGLPDFMNLIRREVSREVARQIRPPRHGVVSAYNPNTASVKVQFPEDLTFDGAPKETGWMPWRVAAGGSGWTANFAPMLGMQVAVNYANGDALSPYATGALHSSAAPPPAVPEGEMWLLHQNGVCLKITADGHIYAGTATGAFKRLATEDFVFSIFNPHTHTYSPGDGTPTQTAGPNMTVTSGDTTNLTVQLKAT